MKLGNYKEYIKYANISIQMMSTIAIATWTGKKLDMYLEMNQPWFLCLFALFSTILSMYIIIKKIV